jgi:hypothetical protein
MKVDRTLPSDNSTAMNGDIPGWEAGGAWSRKEKTFGLFLGSVNVRE